MNKPIYYQPIISKPIWLNVAWRISDLLWMTNYGISFIFYCASGHNFRRALIHMLQDVYEMSRYHWKKSKSDIDREL